MPKVACSFDGRNNNENWEIDQEQTGVPQLTISKGDRELMVTFINDAEYNRYQRNIGLCRATTQDGKEIYLTSLSR